MQFHLWSNPGCDVALEAFRAVGLPIKEKDSTQLVSQERTGVQSAGYDSIPQSASPTNINTRSNSALGAVNLDVFRRLTLNLEVRIDVADRELATLQEMNEFYAILKIGLENLRRQLESLRGQLETKQGDFGLGCRRYGESIIGCVL